MARRLSAALVAAGLLLLSLAQVGEGIKDFVVQSSLAPALSPEEGTSGMRFSRKRDWGKKRQMEFFFCDRLCRERYGFFDRTIQGVKTRNDSIRQAPLRRTWVKKRKTFCRCWQTRADRPQRELGFLKLAGPRMAFDTTSTWSGGTDKGGQSFGFDSRDLCVEEEGGALMTVEYDGVPDVKNASEELGFQVREFLHCGACSSCSAPRDIEILAGTREWITKAMTQVSANFAAPWGHHSVSRLKEDLKRIRFDVSDVAEGNRPTCMDCWTDNIMCTALACRHVCWTKFFSPENPRTSISRKKISLLDLNARCLKCDETNCGPAFIKCAGANRRSSGIVSDIERPEWQQCRFGKYSGVTDLPTFPEPRQRSSPSWNLPPDSADFDG